jgi:hypothetical protein
VVVDTRRLLTCAHVVLDGTVLRQPLWVCFAKLEMAGDEWRSVAHVDWVYEPPVEDLAVLQLDHDVPAGVEAAPLRCPRPGEVVGRRWWAYGFPENDPVGNSAEGLIAAGALVPGRRDRGHCRRQPGARSRPRPGRSPGQRMAGAGAGWLLRTAHDADQDWEAVATEPAPAALVRQSADRIGADVPAAVSQPLDMEQTIRDWYGAGHSQRAIARALSVDRRKVKRAITLRPDLTEATRGQALQKLATERRPLVTMMARSRVRPRGAHLGG